MSNEQPERIDRQRCHADNPTLQISVNMPVSVLDALDDVVVARRVTRSGLIVMAVRAWLEQEASRETADG